MTKRMSIIIVALMVVMTITMVMSAVVIAQADNPSIALPFRRFLGLLGLNSDSVQWHKAEVERLTMLVSIPVGDRSMGDTAGNYINWTQARVDNANALIQGHYTRLAELGEGSWTYTYIPDVIIP